MQYSNFPKALSQILLGTALLVGAHGANAATDAATKSYQSETAACASGASQQDKATCMKEAGAAKDEARKGRLDNGPQPHDKNALDRCGALPATEKSECEARMTKQGNTTTSGSVGGGGVLRETRTQGAPVPAPTKP